MDEDEDEEETRDSFDIVFKNHYVWIKIYQDSYEVRYLNTHTKVTSVIDVYIISGLKTSY